MPQIEESLMTKVAGIRLTGTLIRGFLVAGGVAGVIIGLRLAGVLVGLPVLLFASVLVCALPLSPHLSRRLLIAGALIIGWVPFLWWIPLSLGAVGRSGLLLAVTAGVIAGWVAAGEKPRSRLRQLMPKLMAVDMIILAAVGVAVWATSPLLFSTNPEHTLTILMNGWDHVAHFGIGHLINNQGTITPLLASAPDGGSWIGSNYPQHFHATASAITELYRQGSGIADPRIAVLDYGRTIALISVLSIGLLVASVAQLPALRKRPVIAWPLAAFVLAAFLFGPGTMAFATGYPNFVLACAATGLVILLSVSTKRLTALLVFALGGLLIAVVHGWMLLAPLALVAIYTAKTTLKLRDRKDVWTQRIPLVATIIATLAALPILFSGEPFKLASGGAPVVDMTSFLLVVGVAIGIALIIRLPNGDLTAKNLQLILVRLPLTGVVMLAGLAAYQRLETGKLSYFFGKLATGVMLICVIVLVATIAAWTKNWRTTPASVLKIWIFSAVLTIAAAQTFGYIGPFAEHVANNSPILHWQRDANTAKDESPASRIFRAASLAEHHPFASVVYVAAIPGDPVPLLADQWVRALSLNWSQKANPQVRILGNVGTEFRQEKWRNPVNITKKLLDESSEIVVVIAPEAVEKVRAGLPAAYHSRIITW